MHAPVMYLAYPCVLYTQLIPQTAMSSALGEYLIHSLA